LKKIFSIMLLVFSFFLVSCGNQSSNDDIVPTEQSVEVTDGDEFRTIEDDEDTQSDTQTETEVSAPSPTE